MPIQLSMTWIIICIQFQILQACTNVNSQCLCSPNLDQWGSKFYKDSNGKDYKKKAFTSTMHCEWYEDLILYLSNEGP